MRRPSREKASWVSSWHDNGVSGDGAEQPVSTACGWPPPGSASQSFASSMYSRRDPSGDQASGTCGSVPPGKSSCAPVPSEPTIHTRKISHEVWL